jgi:hypothetical protein
MDSNMKVPTFSNGGFLHLATRLFHDPIRQPQGDGVLVMHFPCLLVWMPYASCYFDLPANRAFRERNSDKDAALFHLPRWR